MTGPKVSVIIPNYNHAKYLDQRIQSVLNQTYQNIEIIILDDCSSDDSMSIIDNYSSNPKVSHVERNNINSGNTFLQWNKGINLAKGELVWIAESDDFCEITLLEELVKAYMHDSKIVLSYNTSTMVDDTGKVTSWKKEFRNKYMSGRSFLRHYFILGNTVQNASSAIFSREVALSISKDYLNYPGAGDFLFWIEIVSRGKVAIVSKELNYFRRHGGVVTSRKDSDGSNLLTEHGFIERIKSQVYISPLREIIIYASKIKRLEFIKFDSEIIRQRVFSAWNYEKYSKPFYKLFERVCNSLRLRYNIYI